MTIAGPARWITATAMCGLLATHSSVAVAHPDHFEQQAYVTVQPNGVDVELDLSPGSLVAAAFVAHLDRNGDGNLSSAEQTAYLTQLVADVVLVVDDIPATLHVVLGAFPTVRALRTGEAQIVVRLRAELDRGPAASNSRHDIRFLNQHQPVASKWMASGFTEPPIKLVAQQRSPDYRELRFATEAGPQPTPAAVGQRWRAGYQGLALVTMVGLGATYWYRQRRRQPCQIRVH